MLLGTAFTLRAFYTKMFSGASQEIAEILDVPILNDRVQPGLIHFVPFTIVILLLMLLQGL